MEEKIRVALVDDHPLVLRQLSCFLRGFPDIDIVGEAADGSSAIELARRVHPDVIVMDVSMPGLSGIDATRIIHSEIPDIRVVILSMFEVSVIGDAARQAGATSCINKVEPLESLLGAIRQHQETLAAS